MKRKSIPGHLWVVLVVVFSLVNSVGYSWTESRLASVENLLTVNTDHKTGELVLKARFEVAGGQFHGFSMAPVQGGALVQAESYAEKDDGTRYGLSITEGRDSLLSVLLEKNKGVAKGAVIMVLKYRMDLEAAGALQTKDNARWLDWTAPVWDLGMDSMSLVLSFAGNGEPPYSPEPIPELQADRNADGALRFIKYRPTRYYSLHVPFRLSGALEAQPTAAVSLPKAGKGSPQTASASVSEEPALGLGSLIAGALPLVLIPLLGGLIGFQLIMRKRRWIQSMHALSGSSVHHVLVPSLGTRGRMLVSLVLLVSAVLVQVLASAAAGVLPLAVIPALWMTVLPYEFDLRIQGGSWRPLLPEEKKRLSVELRKYRRHRLCLLDLSHAAGKLAFVLGMVGLGILVTLIRSFSGRTAFIFGLDVMLLAVPVWFCGSREELPPDPLLSRFEALEKLSGRIRRMLKRRFPGTTLVMWARYVSGRELPVEVRLRLDPLPPDLRGIEMAAEVIRRNAKISMSGAVILRVTPNTELAESLATSPLASDALLTPDLEEEIIILRGRRSRDPWLKPLASAFEIVSATEPP